MKTESMQVSVAICTWNRARLLDKTLANMCRLAVPDGVDWELLVVNNNSSDDTDAVIERHIENLPLRRLFEPEQGHSAARNRALAEAQGELIVWTDDDVLVDPSWLVAYVNAANDWPDAAYFGGRIEPWFEVEPPCWLRGNFQQIKGAYAIRDYGLETRPFEGEEHPAGASMAFRTDILRRYLFRTDLGRRGNSLTSGDETELLQRLSVDGHTGVWVADAGVRHFIPKERLNVSFLKQMYRGNGTTFVRQQGIGNARRMFGIPKWMIRQYVKDYSVRLLCAPFASARWMEAFVNSSLLEGVFAELRRQELKNEN